MISLIIPTYNEAENIKILIPQIHKYLAQAKIDYEIIIVDDNSPDKTWKIAQQQKKYNVKTIRRIDKRGLSSAVIDGINISKGNIIGVMDADLSHPPELLPKMVASLKTNDIVVASRYATNEKTGFTLFRKIVSKTATLMARPLTKVKDPMSGYFFFKKIIIKNSNLKAHGYKILLEILIKGKYDRKKVKEIPFRFEKRHSGKSKLGLGVYAEYIIHIASLYSYKICTIFRK